MKKAIKTILVLLLIALIIIQFFSPAKNISTTVSQYDITNKYAVPADVDVILKKACNDCHSNNTRYPWYNRIQPVAWWLDSHVRDGKRSLNFNEFLSFKIGKQYHRLNDINEEVKGGDMPLSSYTIIHRDAILSDSEKQTLYTWTNGIRDQIKAAYPPDSLVSKKPGTAQSKP